MKLQNPIYVNDEQRSELLKEIKLPVSFFHICSTVILRKEGVDYIIKDRWKNPYCSDEQNIKNLIDKDLYIISYLFLNRIHRQMLLEKTILVGDNIIIEI